ncbi:hypothetical protein FOA52_012384 [Chlamydomonas sp. UWO 241]|nr:hypothetical protein FOA52_012384 [Chlamydomonas sp. UWO 241]
MNLPYLYQQLHIEVNHEKREMSLVVKIKGKIDPNTKAVRDLKQLSGGERSYVTVAFLLAVGEASESPFRCMDEFDVFMDAINRRVATETLLEFAYKHSNFQYVFLTPQDIQAVEDAKCALAVTVKADIPANFLKTVTMRPARPAQ